MHLRIERADDKGSKRIVQYDRFYVVDGDNEVDISNMVKGWQLSARAGEIEQATLYVMGVRVTENPEHLPKAEEGAVAKISK